METELKSIHPFYSLALRRAAKVALKKKEIKKEDFETINGVIRHSVRKSEDGKTCDIMEEARKHTVSMAMQDESLPAEIRSEVVGLNFDWGKIWEWLKTHIPQILSVMASLLTIFMFL
jgi:hypothetical protein